MSLKFFNTMSRQKEEFIPINPGEVRMYTCGPTVYDYAHIGNFRSYIFEDLLRRFLLYKGYNVIQVMNLTDVEDKSIRASRQAGTPLKEFTDKYKEAFFEDLDTLRIQRAEYYPSATDHIDEMVEMVSVLVEKGYGYRADDSIYYSISKFSDYGELAHIKLDDLKAGARVDSDEYEKEEAHDFALWKGWTEADGDVFWKTELGKGRPGWHIECSAMSMKYLGDTFDIHTGGVDNIFPHHQNEIAQSEAYSGKKFVDYWLHAEHLIVEGKKMSKSLGNFYTLRDLVDKGHDPVAIRYALLSVPYRKQLNFTFDALEAAKSAVQRIRDFARNLSEVTNDIDNPGLEEVLKETEEEFEAGLDDDLNIARSLAAIFELIKKGNKMLESKSLSEKDAQSIIALLQKFDTVLDVLEEEKLDQEIVNYIEAKIEERTNARQEQNWELADQIRDELLEKGIVLEDKPEGTVWKKK